MKTALLLIDAQASLLAAAWNSDAVLARLNALLAAARAADSPVLFVRDRRVVPDGSLHPGMAALEGDIDFEKDHCDAFFGTGLKQKLEEMIIGKVVIAGLQTEYCIDTTCRRAISEGFHVVLAGDAHTTLETPELTATTIIAHHNRVLGNLTAGDCRIRVSPATDIGF